MRAIVETTGSHMLMHPRSRETVSHNRPSVVMNDSFIHQHLAIGSVRILARNLPPESSDEEWAEWLKNCDGDVDLAVASYVAKYAETVSDPEPEPATVVTADGDAPDIVTQTGKLKKVKLPKVDADMVQFVKEN